MKMSRKFLAPLAAASLAMALPATAADIQKCLDWDGNVAYQDTPCPIGTAIGAIPRDTSKANPDAVRQAEEDRRLLAQILLAKAARSPAVQVIVPNGGAPAADEFAVEPSYAEPVYGYAAPVYGYGSALPRGHPRGKSRDSTGRDMFPSPITRPPTILDSPAPCNTVQCGQAQQPRGVRGRR
jgi:hypothetical protein